MRQRGFTLIEMLLSVTIIGILVGMSVPIYNSFAVKNELDTTSMQVAGALRRAQVYARAQHETDAWSVAVDTSGIILFKGTDFGARNTAYDEIISLSGSITPSGTTEVNFSRLTGLPAASGSITLTTNSNETRTIAVNAKGMVDY